MNSKNKIVARGVVLITRHPFNNHPTVSAVVGRSDAERMQKRFGGKIVEAKGLPFHYNWQKLRVLDNPAEAIALSEGEKK